MNMQKGFTLAELLIVMAIIGILTAVALPAYQDYVMRGKLIQATAALTDARLKYEQYYQDHDNAYAGAEAIRCPAPTAYFVFACPAPVGDTYVITAVGAGDMAGFTYSINESNVRSTQATVWGKTSGTCWITKSGDNC
ncbi:MAG: prepilin-type N-terminal cleavage/methylation domain-containing protein [Gammaproteobacteria bacterium]|nr:prepilin-type N-terminal cleavage/methylation domain-containing protein [Gammaproteobacteria bacterium]MBU1482550.1 prepilin-type N-terminal cleavage/methylation domain-containing protein [Gammaproteobacteria bacterium]